MEKITQYTDESFFRYFAGRFDAEEEKELLDWLQADAAHRSALAAAADRWAVLHAPLFAARRGADFKARFGWLRAESRFFRRSPVRTMLGMAASLLVLLAVAVAAYHAGGRQAKPDNRRVADVFEASTPLGSKTRLVLPDGTVVWLNAGSTLTCTTGISAASRAASHPADAPLCREVRLEGEAYFEVAPDTLRPFIVCSDRLRVRVTGTHFDVRAYSDEETVDVALVSGQVYVRLDDARAEGRKEVVLAPDRMLSYNKETNCVQVAGITGADAFAWTDGRLKFSARPFPRIAKDLERKFNLAIRVESPALRREVFTGSFPAGMSLDEILREIDMEHKYTWRREGGDLVIRDKRPSKQS